MTETLKERADTVPITLGLKMEDLEVCSQPGIRVSARHLDYLSIDIDPYLISWAGSSLEAQCLPFLGCIARWLADKPVLLQEFGLPTAPTLPEPGRLLRSDSYQPVLINEDDAAKFVENALIQLCRFNLMGALWKSYGDYHPTIWDWPPLKTNPRERFFGILRQDGSPKLTVAAFKSVETKRPDEAISLDWIDTPEEDFYNNPKQHLGRLYRRFLEYFDFN
jgi:hypothetical protein